MDKPQGHIQPSTAQFGNKFVQLLTLTLKEAFKSTGWNKKIHPFCQAWEAA